MKITYLEDIQSKNIYIDLMGSGDIEIGDAKAKSLDVKLLGSGDIEVNGDFEKIAKTKIGNGDIDIN